MMTHVILIVVGSLTLLLGLSCAGSSSQAESDSMGSGMALTSSAFNDGQKMPKAHTGEGKDISPPLAWTGAPSQTRQFALICDDPDAPGPVSPWVHWVIYAIGADVTALPEAIPTVDRIADPPGAVQGNNSWGSLGYRGPLPPRGSGGHHYHFVLYALDTTLSLEPGATKADLKAAMAGHILAEAKLTGTYER